MQLANMQMQVIEERREGHISSLVVYRSEFYEIETRVDDKSAPVLIYHHIRSLI